MTNHRSHKSYRILAVLVALALLVMALPLSVSAKDGLGIKIISVKKNQSVTVEAYGFPASNNFKVRIGPFYTFARNNETVDTLATGNGGTIRFTVNLPGIVKEGDLVAIRLDGDNGYVAYNAFYNNDSNSANPTPTTTPRGTQTPPPSSGGSGCSITASGPGRSPMGLRYDFDATWTIKNTSSKNWETSTVDYKYVNGQKTYKYNALYDLPQTVKPGESITIVVDMTAPDKSGTYSTTWALVNGGTTLCTLPLTITVK